MLCALALSGAAFAGEPGFTPVEPASPNAERINQSYLWIAIFTGVIFVIVEGTLVWFIVRYRADRRPRDMDGAQVHGNTNLELAWTVAPVLILVAIALVHLLQAPRDRGRPRARTGVEVTVEGHQYYWNFIYPNGVIAVDGCARPVGQTTRLEVIGARLRGDPLLVDPGARRQVRRDPRQGQRDVVQRGGARELPRPVRRALRRPARADDGRRWRRCRPPVHAWLAREARAQEAGTSNLGAETFRGACGKCHGLAGEGDIGPPLAGNPLLDDPEAVEQVVRNGRTEMPPVGKSWDERQMKALTEYLQKELVGG